MKMFKLTNLQILHTDMKSKGEKRVTFSINFNKKGFSCIFLTDIFPYRLYITSLGDNPIVFEFEVENGYLIRCFIKNYIELLRYLELKFDPYNKFKPDYFFNGIDKEIPNVFYKKPNYTDVLMVVKKVRKIEDEEKVYFCGWRNNPVNASVTEMNYDKTKSAFGTKKADLCKKNNISSCWTANQKEEVIEKLNDIITIN